LRKKGSRELNSREFLENLKERVLLELGTGELAVLATDLLPKV
jgi:hypothetical protein